MSVINAFIKPNTISYIMINVNNKYILLLLDLFRVFLFTFFYLIDNEKLKFVQPVVIHTEVSARKYLKIKTTFVFSSFLIKCFLT